MAVSKIAVIALVAILAVPILLGYALNLTESTEYDYKTTGDAVNITPLMQNGTGYSYVHADSYRLNTEFGMTSTQSNNNSSIMPIFNSTNSSYKTNYFLMQNQGSGTPPNLPNLSNFNYNYVSIFGNTADNYVSFNIVNENGTVLDSSNTAGQLINWYYDDASKTIHYTVRRTGSDWANSGLQERTFTQPSTASYLGVTYTNHGFTGRYLEHWYWKGDTNGWVNFSAGYYFKGTPSYWTIELPQYTKSYIITVNLDSISDSNYECGLYAGGRSYWLVKSTDNGTISWGIEKRPNNGPVERIDLYYDPNRSDNTYQILFNIEDTGRGTSYSEYFDVTLTARYVGGWPQLIGEANYYQTFTMVTRDIPFNLNQLGSISYLNFFGNGSLNATDNNFRTPTIRIDDAYFRAYEYPVIESMTITPSDYRSNPITTIDEPTLYGDSLVFGGNTYTVTDGKITIGSHQVPVKGLSFSSVLNEFGTYDNRIGKTVISSSATPSTITFNGKWSASVTVQSMESYTYTHTEWNVGKFAWDGIDQNFLIVGLITCLGVFIALGIYARKKGTGGIIPLMIVVGGAAMVFFVML